jgi:predicted RNA-binding protein with PUA-like domain
MRRRGAKTTMAAQYWLMKSEPYAYSWQQLVKDGKGRWDGVRNFSARNNLRRMKPGDLSLFYHSNVGKEVVGVMKIAREAYADPTAEGGDWSAVDVTPVQALAAPVTLSRMRQDPAFADCLLLKRSRLSVMPISASHFRRILKLAKTKL